MLQVTDAAVSVLTEIVQREEATGGGAIRLASVTGPTGESEIAIQTGSLTLSSSSTPGRLPPRTNVGKSGGLTLRGSVPRSPSPSGGPSGRRSLQGRFDVLFGALHPRHA
jgi:hypothetical protein